MIVAVTGGRNFSEAGLVFAALDSLVFGLDLADGQCIDVLRQGGASGLDHLARRWAASRRIAVQDFPAEWERCGPWCPQDQGKHRRRFKDPRPDRFNVLREDYCPLAGPVRNRRMLEGKLGQYTGPVADLLVAFPGGTGTADCVAAAEGLGILTHKVVLE